MQGSPNRQFVIYKFKFSCLPLLAEIAAKICEPMKELGMKIQKYDELADWVTPAYRF